MSDSNEYQDWDTFTDCQEYDLDSSLYGCSMDKTDRYGEWIKADDHGREVFGLRRKIWDLACEVSP